MMEIPSTPKPSLSEYKNIFCNELVVINKHRNKKTRPRPGFNLTFKVN